MVTRAGKKRYNSYLTKVKEAGFGTENEADCVEPITATMGEHSFEIQDGRFFGRRRHCMDVFWVGSKHACGFSDIDTAIDWMKTIARQV